MDPTNAAARRRLAVRSVGRTDVGRRRAHNEDAMFADDVASFYVVADGVGGNNKGEIASREAIEQLRMWMAKQKINLDSLRPALEAGDLSARAEIRRQLEAGVQSACYMVFGMGQFDPEMRGMATTISALLILGGFAFAAHVGDSRVYRVRGDTILQITEDHTLINYKLKHRLITPEQAEQAAGKNVITRAVGHKDHVQVDTADIDALAGDIFVMCTDGLHGYLRDPSEVIELVGDGNLESGANAAIALANQRGGKDNITIVIAQVYEQVPRRIMG